MKGILLTLMLSACLLAQPALAQEDTPVDYEKASKGTRWLGTDKSTPIFKVLVEASNLGGNEVESAEITFRPSPEPGRPHQHKSLEIFYVLSGEFEHIVNDTLHVLTPGMVGIVRPGDWVRHQVRSSTPVKTLVIWVPSGEVERLAGIFESWPIEDGEN